MIEQAIKTHQRTVSRFISVGFEVQGPSGSVGTSEGVRMCLCLVLSPHYELRGKFSWQSLECLVIFAIKIRIFYRKREGLK